MPNPILDSVKARYGAVAESSLSSDHAGVKAVAEAFGYTAEELTSIPAAIASSLAAYVGCIAGAIPIETYRTELLNAGFSNIAIVDSGADLNAYAKVENQSACCSPAMDAATPASCCTPAAPDAATLHADLAELLSTYDVNASAASVKVYALKPVATSCCGPTCGCPPTKA